MSVGRRCRLLQSVNYTKYGLQLAAMYVVCFAPGCSSHTCIYSALGAGVAFGAYQHAVPYVFGTGSVAVV